MDHSGTVWNGLLAVAVGVIAAALGVQLFRSRTDTVNAERWLFGRGRVAGWNWYWRLRRWDQVVVAVVLVAIGVSLVVVGVTRAV